MVLASAAVEGDVPRRRWPRRGGRVGVGAGRWRAGLLADWRRQRLLVWRGIARTLQCSPGQGQSAHDENDDCVNDEEGQFRDWGLTGGMTVLSAGSWGRLVVRRRCWRVDGGGNIESEQGDGSAVAVSKVRGANL